jgi:predicted ATP-grasp superfamily ATP-dependent carboligase
MFANPRAAARKSKFWRGTFEGDILSRPASMVLDDFIRMAEAIGSRPILIPTDDDSSLFVADNAAVLKEFFRFPNQPSGLARSLSNKEAMYHLAREHGVPTPQAFFPQSRGHVESMIDDMEFPLMLKGIDTVALLRTAGRRMVTVHDKESLLRHYDAMAIPGSPNLMLQEFIAGDAEDVWMFDGYFDQNSDCLFSVTGRKLRQYPAYTGLTSLGICEPNQMVADQTIAFMTALGYRGILDCGYKFNARTGEYNLLDVNPRVGTTFRLFVDNAGNDCVRALYRDLTGQMFEVGSPIDGRKWLAEPFDLVSSFRYWRDGKLRARDWIKSFRGVEEAQWYAQDDLMPFVHMWLRAVEGAVKGKVRC